VLVGEGSEKVSLITKVEQLSLKNVDILDSMPKVELVKLVAACDVSIVIFSNYSILEHNSANKFFDSLSAGKPILLNYSGWQRKILEDNNAGYGCDLCNIDEFVEKVLYLNSHRDALIQMGQNARRVAIEEFDRDKLAAQALSVLEKMLN
jgi:glycosyltransferase involved in cell wall biosynthesis